MKTFLTIILTALIAASVTWFIVHPSSTSAPSAAAERQPLFYQCAMHPWIKSDKPGRCTICGMELTPVYAGQSAPDSSVAGDDVVTLTQNQIQVLHVETAEAKVRPLVRTLQVAGSIDANLTRRRVLAAYVEGRIDKLYVNYPGAEVEAGQPLVDFYSPALLQAAREYRQLTGQLRETSALRLRQMGLTQEQLTAIDQQPANSLSTQILSPLSGTVVSQSVYEGQYVATGQQLFEIVDLSTMWFMFRAYEQDMPWIKTGLTVIVTTPSLPNRTFTGKITFIDPNFDAATRSTQVRVELPNPLVNGRRELFNRLYADGAVALESPDVLTVPRSAVLQTGSQAVVYIDRHSGAYVHTPVTIGRRGDEEVEILSGLKAGDQVVTNGNLLIDGQAEMNRAFTTPPETTVINTGDPIALTDAQQQALAAFVKTADAMAAALAADDLTAFNTASAPAMTSTATLIDLLRPRLTNPEALNQARHFHGFKDLASARAAFRRFSVAATSALEPLRKATSTPGFQLYECPMVDQAIPGAPKRARWLQTAGREMQNPFFGRAMPDCGEEIK